MNNSTTRTVRLVRRLAAVVVVALVVVVARLALGPWPTAVPVAASGLWAGLRAWWHIETRGRVAPPPACAVARPIEGPRAHVAFARGLAAVSAAYLSECEREANQP